MHDNSILVLVTNQYSCERLIEAGATIAKEKSCGLFVLSIQPKNAIFKIAQELDYLFQKSIQNNAQMTVLFDDNAPAACAQYIKAINASDVVAGTPKADDTTGFLTDLLKTECVSAMHIVDNSGKYVTFESVCKA